jgi:hypothetical protein
MRDKARHIVTVKRPPSGNHGARGQKQGEDETIYANWPCSIVTLSGSEAELARQTFPSASLTVNGYTDPKKPIKPTDYLLLGSRRINVGFVNNIDQLGLEAELICGES